MAAPEQNRPSVIVSDLDIVYRVFGAKRRGNAKGQGESTILRRLMQIGQNSTVGISEVKAVTDASFVVHHGESVGIIGRNGSGKSTILRAIAGLIPPTKGSVWVDGRAALLGVNAVLMSGLSGERNVVIGGQALGLSPQEVKERYQEIVDFSGIGDFIHMPMSAYSSGMAARLRFAISTAAVPDVLIVDEALATGDASFRRRSQQRIQEIREHAGTVFLVSHNNRQIRNMCDRVLWMHDGRIIMDGAPDEVLPEYQRSTEPPRARGGAGAPAKAGARGPGARRKATRRQRRHMLRPASQPPMASKQGKRPRVAGERHRPPALPSQVPSVTALDQTSNSRPNHVPTARPLGRAIRRPGGKQDTGAPTARGQEKGTPPARGQEKGTPTRTPQDVREPVASRTR
ncbi:MAG TPA: ATP-binding cassette domain-containing protein [Segeticoccus sp.]|uniref:ABC transporter ATP-binding protein n=1 Tax=Segeticoccus sp. TaxID=2706531 RepID=UPI002D7F0498|nr:ATP-binding cassette domain-containing protein [Segeticoccus sp.]HET8602275.1 ATP-binding cassette domain-containing protein [Segeticoccus sp.]